MTPQHAPQQTERGPPDWTGYLPPSGLGSDDEHCSRAWPV